MAWNWGSSHIEGVVKEKSEEKMTKTSKGKQITRNGEPDNPAYFVEQTKKGVLFRALQLLCVFQPIR